MDRVSVRQGGPRYSLLSFKKSKQLPGILEWTCQENTRAKKKKKKAKGNKKTKPNPCTFSLQWCLWLFNENSFQRLVYLNASSPESGAVEKD